VARTSGLALVVALAVLGGGPASHAVTYKPYYEGLPDYDARSPFRPIDGPLSADLAVALRAARIAATPCPAVSLGEYFEPLAGNVCQPADAARIKRLLARAAPSLVPDRLALWLTDLEADGEPELVLMYSIPPADRPATTDFDPYTAFWLLHRAGPRYAVTHFGIFLAGRVHAVASFGPDRTRKVVFVRHVSCTECHPWVYLTAAGFDGRGGGSFFEFTYSKDHAGWAPQIEYELPGMGHSTDAAVETRIPRAASSGAPHLIQHFALHEGGSEWWIFRCRSRRCDYERHDALSARYAAHWRAAGRL
jgi:hypothetical protein